MFTLQLTTTDVSATKSQASPTWWLIPDSEGKREPEDFAKGRTGTAHQVHMHSLAACQLKQNELTLVLIQYKHSYHHCFQLVLHICF